MRTSLALPLILLLGASAGGNAQDFLTNGLVAFYPLSGDANDRSGNGHNGVTNGLYLSATNNQIGLTGTATHFKGGSYISVTPTPFDVNSDWTISVFCRLDLNSGVDNFLSTGNDNANGINLRYVYGAPAPWQFSEVNLGPGSISDATNTPTQWNLFTCVRSGALFQMFLNDVLVTSTNVVATAYDMGSLMIGRHAGGTAYSLTGALSDLRIYNRALSTDEVQQLYQYEIAPPPSPQMGLVKALRPAFSDLVPGIRYQLQVSGDLNTWTNSGSPFTATAAIMRSSQCFDVEDWGSELFFRAQVCP